MTRGALAKGAAPATDALELAGDRLDAAAAEIERLCRPPAPLPDEALFGAAEAAFTAARQAYRCLLADCLGQDADAVARRLSW